VVEDAAELPRDPRPEELRHGPGPGDRIDRLGVGHAGDAIGEAVPR
jgi:hypothetical protein